MDFKKYLKAQALELEKEENKILGKELAYAGKTDKKLIPLIKAFIASCKGGKRIRGALVKLGYEMAGGTKAEIVKIGSAYEILHTSVLIHDDIMDQSPQRRGNPSLYKALGDNHYGVSQAISLADFGFFLCVKIISQSNFPSERKNKALETLSKIMTDTALGQMLDIEKANPVLVNKLKTACYTIAGPLQIGAVLAGADEKLLKNLSKAGENLGIAYQLKDDILDNEVKDPQESVKEAGKYIKKALNFLPQAGKTGKLLREMAQFVIERTK